MTQPKGGFPIGKLVSLAVLLGLTVLPVVSCQTLEFTGHEILRNEPPDMDGMEEALKGLGGAPDVGTGSDPSAPSFTAKAGKPDRDTLFPPEQRWMHWLYLAVFGAALASIFLRSGSAARAALGAFGIAGLILFLERFQTGLMGDNPSSPGGATFNMFKWDSGAYVAVFGFAFMIIECIRARSGGSSRVVD